jgi:hypothetical protein
MLPRETADNQVRKYMSFLHIAKNFLNGAFFDDLRVVYEMTVLKFPKQFFPREIFDFFLYFKRFKFWKTAYDKEENYFLLCFG